ncbi:MAG: VRR-NUC domain-containing protein [Moorellales bacterium]
MKVTEAEIQRQIRDYLRWTGWFVIRNHQSLGSHRGLADLTAVKDGWVVWIEVKVPGGRQSKYQEEFQRQIEAHGGTYILARSVEDVERALEGVRHAAAGT